MAIVTSLCVHHLDGDGKRRLFRDLHLALVEGGALLIADLVAPASAPAQRLLAASWDARARTQSLAATGSDAGFRRFQETEWNLYRHPDPVDIPSPLFDQLQWLAEAGYAGVDAFWMDAGHAIYGGYRDQPPQTIGDGDLYEAARAVVERILGA
jgi:tRNA (cmo5U34)-methyltransferase